MNFTNLGMAQLSLGQGNYDEALAYLLKSRGIKKAANTLYWLSAAHAGKGDKEKALATLEEAFQAGYRDFDTIHASPYSY